MNIERKVDLDFISVDVETACADRSSICQFGIAEFRNGECVRTDGSLINPGVQFSPFNIRVHQITESHVVDHPGFDDFADIVCESLTCGMPVVSHSSFDRSAIEAALCKCNRPFPDVTWLDSMVAAKAAWPSLPQYKLSNLADRLGIEFRHHDAIEDARVSGLIMVSALTQLGKGVSQFHEISSYVPDAAVSSGRSSRYPPSITRDGDPSGALAGHVIVFTGELTITRSEAADLAAKAGCRVETGVTKRTTLVVVGDQDLSILNGHSKSTKHRRAEELIERGQDIAIIQESEFLSIVEWSERECQQ